MWHIYTRECYEVIKKNKTFSPVIQWLRICLVLLGTPVQSLVQEIPHAAEQLSLCTATTAFMRSRACALQQEKPPRATPRESPRTATQTQSSQS